VNCFSGIAIVIGALVGEIASRLYVPIIQITYSASEQSIPLIVITRQDDYVRLFTIVGSMVLLCIAILSVLISKIKIAQALKLGED